jgi:putative inorganic carbon (hco3(-)) transporter
LTFKLYLLVLFLTFVRPIDGFFPELLEYRPMLILYALCGIVSIVKVAGKKPVSNEGATGRSALLVAIFVVALCLSHIANGWFGGALKAISDQSPTVALFALTLLNVDSLDRLRSAGRTVLLAIFLMSCLAIASFHTGVMFDLLVLQQSASESTAAPSSWLLLGDLSRFDNGYFYRIRGFGFLADPNDLAQAIVTCIPFLLASWVPKANFRNLLLRGAPVLIMLYAIYLTQSRGAIFGLGAITFYGLYRRFGAALSVSGLVAGGFAMLAVGLGGGRSLSSDEASAGERIEAWGQGFAMFKSHPLFGVGYDRFLEHHILTAHNSFVLCFSELGMFGYFIWIGFIVMAFLQLNAVIKANRLTGRSSSAVSSGVSGVSGALGAVGAVGKGGGKLVEKDALSNNKKLIVVEAQNWPVVVRTSLIGFLACAFFLSRTYSLTLFFLLALSYSIAKMSIDKPAARNLASVTTPRWFRWTFFWVVTSMVAIYGAVRVGNL